MAKPVFYVQFFEIVRRVAECVFQISIAASSSMIPTRIPTAMKSTPLEIKMNE